MGKCSVCGKEVSGHVTTCATCGATGLDEKKARVMEKDRKWVSKAIIAAGAVFVLLAGWLAISTLSPKAGSAGGMMTGGHREGARPAATAVTPVNGVITVSVKDLGDGGAHYYSLAAGGKDVRFFLIRASDGTVRAALDACTACYRAKLGYSRKDDTMICNNCGMAFRSTDVGVISGGCSPIPVNRTVDGQTVTIQAKEIEAGAKYF